MLVIPPAQNSSDVFYSLLWWHLLPTWNVLMIEIPQSISLQADGALPPLALHYSQPSFSSQAIDGQGTPCRYAHTAAASLFP